MSHFKTNLGHSYCRLMSTEHELTWLVHKSPLPVGSWYDSAFTDSYIYPFSKCYIMGHSLSLMSVISTMFQIFVKVIPDLKIVR
jgi:hypothetical protein